ncbi:MAG: D-glucuronyl C5-epimerase family protein [Salibacteraceae bacterium]|nr:D-glucuronyl C5-epimerase family protein [Salibacteraceae bacterium]
MLLYIRLAIVSFLSLFCSCQQDSNRQRASSEIELRTDLPALSDALQRKQDYYKLVFLKDGFPGKLISVDSVFPHPIYGSYVLLDYLKQYEFAPNDSLYNALNIVAKAAINRMDTLEDGLVFWYPKGDYVSKAFKPHISGLTQSYYLNAFQRLYQVTGDSLYERTALKIFKSLLIPKDKHGVFHEWSGGIAFEELPETPNSFILNGWLSILYNIKTYADASGNLTADSIFQLSLESLGKLLPKYDNPELSNSRYALSGFEYFKLINASDGRVEVEKPCLFIPNEGSTSLPIADPDTANRWTSYAFGSNSQALNIGPGKYTKFNLVLSRISYPDLNELQFSLKAEQSGKLIIQAYYGNYSPRSTSFVNAEWVNFDTINIRSGLNKIRISIPWTIADLIAYPTSFSKKFGNDYYNVYHFVHIDRLNQLSQYSDNPNFQLYLNKWNLYVEKWPNMPLYQNVMTHRAFQPKLD